MEGSSSASFASALLVELASEVRCSILTSLNTRPARLSTIARELDTTVQDVYRNINKLAESGLVTRGGDGKFELTELGMIVLRQIPFFHFVKKHDKFFEKHTVRDLPDKFVLRMGELEGCELFSNVTQVLEKIKKLESNTHEQLRLMIAQAWTEEGNILADIVRGGVDVFLLAGGNTILPREVIESTMELDRLRIAGKIKARLVNRVSIAMYIADNQSAILFPNISGAIEMNSVFIGSQPKAKEWCLDLFNHMWESAGPFNIEKMTVV